MDKSNFFREPEAARWSGSRCRSVWRRHMPPASITVLLVDDHSLVRRGFRRMLEDDPDILVVGEASDGNEAVEKAIQLRPQVIVMDFALPSMNGAVATRLILKSAPETAILMLSMH